MIYILTSPQHNPVCVWLSHLQNRGALVKNLHKLTQTGKAMGLGFGVILTERLGFFSSIHSTIQIKVTSSYKLQLETFLSVASDWPGWVICISRSNH